MEGEIFDAIASLLEVKYMYSAMTQAHASGEAPVLTDEMLSELPAELLKKLRHATLVLDRAAMAVLIERIEAQTPVDGFQFGRIRNLPRDVI